MPEEDASRFFLDRSTRTKPKRIRKPAAETKPVPLKTGRGSAWRHTRTGYRKDLDLICRSGWEANVARVMRSLDIAFEFEPQIFSYPVKRGVRSYCPDFLLKTVERLEEWVEVKGYFDTKSRVKIKRFKRYYPEEFAGLTMIIGRAKASIEICENLGVSYLFYEDIEHAFASQLPTWGL